MKKERTIVATGILSAIVLALVISLYQQPVLESPYHYHKEATNLQALPSYTQLGAGNYTYIYNTSGEANYTMAYYSNDSGATWVTANNTTFIMNQGDTLTVTYSGLIE
jgi:uncharacterized protein YpmB